MFTDGGTPDSNAYCQACFDLQGNGDLLDINTSLRIGIGDWVSHPLFIQRSASSLHKEPHFIKSKRSKTPEPKQTRQKVWNSVSRLVFIADLPCL